jgi:S-adenosylmethionine decarboxylase
MLLKQALGELYGCGPAIDDEAALLAAAKAAAAAVGATVVGETAVRYVPHGLTVAVFLAESHIVLTTWPEHRLTLVDVLLCNPEQSHEAAIRAIAERLCPDGEVRLHEVGRFIAATPPPLD